jgi:hypothetical protein
MIKADLRPFKESLIKMVQTLPVRLGRIFALGGWGDAVIATKNVRDLRGIALLAYALDPNVDVDGKRRATPLAQKEFETKLLAYEKRLEELDDQQILARLSGVQFERHGDIVVVDVLEADGTWDQRKSMMMEQQLAAWDAFSMIPGAPSTKKVEAPATNGGTKPAAAAAAATKPPAPSTKAPEPKPIKAPEPKGPPLSVKELDGKVLLVFPPERFDLDVAAALGKRDWETVVRATDNVSGALRDKMHRDGATWVAPLEFLSEVFVDGKPLTKQQFEKDARAVDGGRALDVHFPRFGDVVLIEIAGKRFVTSLTDRAERVATLVK